VHSQVLSLYPELEEGFTGRSSGLTEEPVDRLHRPPGCGSRFAPKRSARWIDASGRPPPTSRSGTSQSSQLVDGQQEFLVLVAPSPRGTATGEAGEEHERIVSDGTTDPCGLGTVTIEGDLDFRGILAVSKQAPVSPNPGYGKNPSAKGADMDLSARERHDACHGHIQCGSISVR
jgi:hypothetical protein